MFLSGTLAKRLRHCTHNAGTVGSNPTRLTNYLLASSARVVKSVDTADLKSAAYL